jgi:hypothetical protein
MTPSQPTRKKTKKVCVKLHCVSLCGGGGVVQLVPGFWFLFDMKSGDPDPLPLRLIPAVGP